MSEQESANDLQPVGASYADVEDQLFPEFIKAVNVAEYGAFNILGSSRRDARVVNGEKFGASIDFEIQIVEPGPNFGTRGTVSLGETLPRMKLAVLVTQRGGVGPVVLRSIAKPGKKPVWAFVTPTNDSMVADTQDLPF